MKLAISVRIAEGFLSKEIPLFPLQEVLRLATQAGYSAICMRASQLGVQSSKEEVLEAIEAIRKSALPVNMVTGDFDMVYNNERGPNALRNIAPYLQLAQSLGAPMVRVAIRKEEDIPWAQRAADQAAEFGIRLVHQCHIQSLFETVDSIESTLKKIGRPNFGLVYEPANLEQCGQPYDASTIARLAPWIFNVYVQNQSIQADGAVTLDTWCRGPVRFNIIPVHAPGGINFSSLFEGLKRVDYEGFITVHQSATDGETPAESAQKTADFLRSFE